VFSEKTIEGAFWHIKELGDVFFDGNVITSGAGKAKLFDELSLAVTFTRLTAMIKLLSMNCLRNF